MAPQILNDIWDHIKWFYDDKVHFLQLHYFYILVLIFITSFSFYFQPGTEWNYIDALFMAATAATNTGLNTINMSALTTWQLVTMYFSSFCGSHIMISIIILQVRRHYFSKRFEDILIFNKAQRLREANRRKFEKNIQEMERQRRKSAAAMDSTTKDPSLMRRRLSFMSVRSSPQADSRNDEEDNDTTLPTTTPMIKRSRFSAPRSLSTGFSSFDFLSHFRKKSNLDNSDIESIPPEFDDAIQNRKSSVSEDEARSDTKSLTFVNHPHQAHSKKTIPRHHSTSELEDDIISSTSSTLKNDTSEDSSNNSHRRNFQASLPLNINKNNTHTRHLSYQPPQQSSSGGYLSTYGSSSSNKYTKNNYPNSLTLTNTAESILSNSSSQYSNFNNNKNTSKNSNLNPIGVSFSTAAAAAATSKSADEDAPHHPTDTTATTAAGEENNNSIVSSNQGIAFAENIERQREIARRRLEKDRKFEDILQRIAGDSDSTNNVNASNLNSIDQASNMMGDAESDDEEMKRIMREPIHKSELTRQQRYRLGGAEYRAIFLLTRLVPIYYLFCTLGFGFVVRIYVAASTYAQEILRTSNSNGPVNEWFFSFFASLSSFNNLGLLQLDANVIPFQSCPGLLIPLMFLILAGNTAYAIFLRLIIWTMYKLTPKKYHIRRETFRYLLDHPRRCYTTLFPATQTKWLAIVLFGITMIEFTCFVALNFWLPVLQGIDWGARVLDGFFQSVATRNAGFAVVDLGALNPGTQIVFIVAMYISVYPVAISMRNSNVYQERALGIYSGNDDDDSEFEPEPTAPNLIHRLRRSTTINSVMTTSKRVLRKPDFFVMTQIQRQLTSEICWVIVCIFAICVIEAEQILSVSPVTISTVIYECVSAFGNVGGSTGYPGTPASQAQQYHTLSKLVLILLMYRGRHRGLPAAIDRAVLLPSEQLEEKEQQDHLLRRRNTSISVADGSSNGVLFYTRSGTL